MASDLEAYLAAPVERVDIGTELRYRRFGRGPAVVLVHGWPLNGATYRGLVRTLSRQFTCYVPDLPGAGESPWDPRTREVFTDWGQLLVRFIAALGLERVALIGHDSGGGIARVAAAALGDKVTMLTLIDTEVSGHTPMLVALYQRLASLPGASSLLGTLAGRRWYRRSRMGFGGCFADLNHLDGEFHQACVAPLIRDPGGAMRTLAHVDLSMSHRWAEVHARICAPTLLVWGDRDPFFPVQHARTMQQELQRPLGLCELPGQRLFVQDERPDLVAAQVEPHLVRLHGSGVATPARAPA